MVLWCGKVKWWGGDRKVCGGEITVVCDLTLPYLTLPYLTLIGKNQRKTEKTAFCLSIDSKKLRKTISKELRFAPSFTDTMWFIMNYYVENCSML